MNRFSLKWHLVEGLVAYDFTLHLRVVTTLHEFGGVLGHAFGHFLLGSHNVMIMSLGLCVKWP